MIKYSINNYLQQEGKALSKILGRLGQLIQWNSRLRECLEVNDLLREHCQIINVSANSLIVIADSPHWVTRLRFLIPELLPKLQKYPGLENIQAICCKVVPNYRLMPPKVRRPRQKISPATAAIIREITHKLEDEKLRAIFEKIALHSEGK